MSKLSIYPVTLDGTSVEKKRQEVRKYFHNTYDLFEKVFEVLKNDEVFYKKSELTRHPMIFYFGHTATFFINKLINMKIIKERINPKFESIFAVGVDEMDWDDINSNNYCWPKVSDVREYRDIVRELVDELIMTMPLTLPICDDSDMWIILMGIEHERIHIETSLVLHTQMPLEFIKETDVFKTCTHTGTAPKNEMISIESQKIELGKDKSHHLYGWDNEYGTYSEDIDAFKTSKYLVSNGEYMEFVLDGGYENDEYWDAEGKKYLESSNAKYPIFWVLKNGVYSYRTLSAIIDMPQDWPVEVNALESEAFCRYKSKKEGLIYSLPSEAEYRAIYNYTKIEDLPQFHESRANLNFYHYASSCPVNEFSFNGIYDVVGNVWQWSRTPIRGFDGFEVHPAYDDFSVPTFDEKHSLILGSSWASSGNLIMKSSRYAFRKHFPQFAGFRYLETNNKDTKNIYYSDKLAFKSYEYQYKSFNSSVDDFFTKCVNIINRYANKNLKVLDVGCSTGRMSFELAKYFSEVTGVDSSARFIQIGTSLLNEDNPNFKLPKTFHNVKNKVNFSQVDYCNIKSNFKDYDLLFIASSEIFNSNYCNFFESLSRLLNQNALVVIVNCSKYVENELLSNQFNIYKEETFEAHNINNELELFYLTIWKKDE